MSVLPFGSYRGIDAPGTSTSGTLHDEFVQTDDATSQRMRVSYRGFGQSWDSGGSPSEVSGVVIRVHRQNMVSARGVVRVAVYAHSGTYGTSSVPTGDPLVVSDYFAAEDFPTSPSDQFFALSGWTPDPSTDYVVVFEGDVPYGFGAETESISVIVETGAEATHGGNASILTASGAATSADDMAFKVYYAASGGGGTPAIDVDTASSRSRGIYNWRAP